MDTKGKGTKMSKLNGEDDYWIKISEGGNSIVFTRSSIVRINENKYPGGTVLIKLKDGYTIEARETNISKMCKIMGIDI